MLDKLKHRIAITDFSNLTDFGWFLLASPLLWWAFGGNGNPWSWPKDAPQDD